MVNYSSLGLIAQAANLEPADANTLNELIKVFNQYKSRNAKLTKYYEGKVGVKDVDIGLSVPHELRNLRVNCHWPSKAVDALQFRSRFDSILCEDGTVKAEYEQIVKENMLQAHYPKAVTAQLKHGPCFITLTMGENDRAQIKFHTASSAAALWNGEHDRVDAGFAIVDTAKFNGDRSYKPSLVNMYTSDNTIVLRRTNSNSWVAEYHPHKMGRPLFDALIYNPSFEKPFGCSRISNAVMDLTDEYIRTLYRMSVAAEIFTTPQKYILGADASMMKEINDNVFDTYMTSILALPMAVDDYNNESKPSVGSFQSASMTPFIEELRSLAANFSGATNIPVSELGVISDNPSSAEAIYAAKEALVAECTALNMANGHTLETVVKMAYCMNNDLSFNELDDEHNDITADFMNPATPSVVSQADAMTKIAAVDEGFAGTPTFYRNIGFNDATIEKLRSEKAEYVGNALLESVLNVEVPYGDNTAFSTE